MDKRTVFGNVVKILVGEYKGGNGIVRELSGTKVRVEVDPFGKCLWFKIEELE